ncbi:hypothetical protein PS684_00161 [Pseudomonas fluorescens]|nr:hypothetical protein PS681_01003 [Pseudomonas fluorescens]VVN50037.1 hypothetical protein PS684_00161 [Pseudomonas fluorescens]
MEIEYGSVCSGIEAATLAWKPLGMRATWFAEIEAFPSAVLAHHYPNTPNLGDMTKLGAQVLAGKIPAPDVLVGGTPCQPFFVAGMREGLADTLRPDNYRLSMRVAGNAVPPLAGQSVIEALLS